MGKGANKHKALDVEPIYKMAVDIDDYVSLPRVRLRSSYKTRQAMVRIIHTQIGQESYTCRGAILSLTSHVLQPKSPIMKPVSRISQTMVRYA